MPTAQIAKKILEHYRERGLTYQEIADRIGVSYFTVYIHTNELDRRMRDETASKIISSLEVTKVSNIEESQKHGFENPEDGEPSSLLDWIKLINWKAVSLIVCSVVIIASLLILTT